MDLQNAIPYSLRATSQWGLRYNGRKPAFDLLDFSTAWSATQDDSDSAIGTGIWLTERDAYVAGTLTDCRDPDSGELAEVGARLVDAVPGYWEVAPNPADLTFIGKATRLGEFSGHGLTVLSSGAFIPITGMRISIYDPQEISGQCADILVHYAKYGRLPSPIAEEPPRFPFIYPDEFIISSESYLIDDWIPLGDTSVLYAPKLHYKTFVAVDMALCVAAGLPWHGHDVAQGLVTYIAGEGNAGLQRRCAGWAIKNRIPLESLPLAVSKWPMRVRDDDSIDEWREHIAEVERHFSAETALIVLDTLSSNFGEGDENSTSDMASFLARVSFELRPNPRCAILIVHHPGKDKSRGARGAYSLEANSAAVFTIEKPDQGDDERRITLVAKALKDGALPPPKQLRAVPVTLMPNTQTLAVESILSAREAAVLRLSVAGIPQRQIAEQEKISQPRVSAIQRQLRALGHLS